MADCLYSIDEVRFDVRDPQLTHAWVFISVKDPTGLDCPISIAGWHHKTFPARMSTLEIHQKEITDCILWPLEAPPDCPPVQPNPYDIAEVYYNKLVQSLEIKPRKD